MAWDKEVHRGEFEIKLPASDKHVVHKYRNNINKWILQRFQLQQVSFSCSVGSQRRGSVLTTLSRSSNSCAKPVQTMRLIKLLPSKCIKMQTETTTPASLQEAIKFSESDLPRVWMIPSGYHMRVTKCKQLTKCKQQQATFQNGLPKKVVHV